MRELKEERDDNVGDVGGGVLRVFKMICKPPSRLDGFMGVPASLQPTNVTDVEIVDRVVLFRFFLGFVSSLGYAEIPVVSFISGPCMSCSPRPPVHTMILYNESHEALSLSEHITRAFENYDWVRKQPGSFVLVLASYAIKHVRLLY